jgi:hypothetical protein
MCQGSHPRWRLAGVALAILLTDHAAAEHRSLTINEAEHLPRAALSAETQRLPGLSLESPQKPGRKAVTFDVLWANPGPGSVHVQFLVVDLETAEVWELMLCKHVVTHSLQTAQRALRNRLSISPSEIKRARALAEQSGCFFE